MAGIQDMFGAGALAALGKAAGQDFVGPFLEETRSRDRFVFQRKQLEEAQARERTRAKGERVQSQSGLLRALKAAGAFNEEDFVAAGGTDALASLDPSDFEIAISQLKENKLQSLSMGERKKNIAARMAARNFPPLHEEASEATWLEVEQRLNLMELDSADRKQQRREVRADAHNRLASTGAVFQDLTADPTRVDEGTLEQIQGMLDADAAYLSNQEDVDPDDLEILQRQHQVNANTFRRATTMAAAATVARGTRGEILEAWAANPDMRSALSVHDPVKDARREAAMGAEFIERLDDASAAHLGLGGLKEKLVAGGGSLGVLNDGALAAQVAAETGRIGEYQERLRNRERDRAAAAQAGTAASELRGALGESVKSVAVEGFIKDGVFDHSAYGAAALEPMVQAIPGMDRRELLNTQRRLAKAGLPRSLIAAPMALVEQRLAQMVDEVSPVDVIRQQAEQEGLRYEAVSEAMAISPLREGRPIHPSGDFVYPHAPDYKVATLNGEWTGAMVQAFKGLDEELQTRRNDLLMESQKLEAAEAEFVDSPEERVRIEQFKVSLRPSLERVEARTRAREVLGQVLTTLPLSAPTEDVAGALHSVGGGKDADTKGRESIEAGLGDGDPEQFLMSLQEQMLQGMGDLTPTQRIAVAEEITMLKEVVKRIVPMFEGEDREEVLKQLKREGIIQSTSSTYPEMEVLTYFMANR